MRLLTHAKERGAVINSGSLCLPAGSLVQFLNIATGAGYAIRYCECLYFHEVEDAEPGGTGPSMDLSRDFVPGQTVEEFIALAGQLSSMGIERAAKRNIRPFYQVGLEPDLEPVGADLPVRR